MLFFFVVVGSLGEAGGDFIVVQSSKHVHFLPEASSVAVDEIAAIIAASFGLPFQKVGTSTPVLSGGELSLSVQLCSAVVMRISPHAHPTPSHLLSLSAAHASWMYGGI